MAQLKDLLVDGKSRFIDKIYANDQFISKVAQGTSPFLVDSSTLVTNLNADLLDGHHYTDFSLTSHSHTWIGDGTNKLYAELNNEINFGGTNTGTTMYFSYRAKDSRPIITSFVFGGSNGSATLKAKQFISSATQGTAPIKTDSSTLVTNLNADYLDGFHAADFRNNIIDLRATPESYNPTYLKDIVRVDENEYYQLLAGNSVTKNGITHTYNSSNLYLVDKEVTDVAHALNADLADYATTAGGAEHIHIYDALSQSYNGSRGWYGVANTPPNFQGQDYIYATWGLLYNADRNVIALGFGNNSTDTGHIMNTDVSNLKQNAIYLKDRYTYISYDPNDNRMCINSNRNMSIFADGWLSIDTGDREVYMNSSVYMDGYLDMGGNCIGNADEITANWFYGNFEGDLYGNATTASGLKYASNITTQANLDNFLTGGQFKAAVFTGISSVGMGSNDGMVLSIPWSSGTQYGAQLAIDDNKSGIIKFRQKSSTWGDWITLWNSANDGSASGLDADMVDGLHSSDLVKLFNYSIPATKGVRISFTSYNSCIINCCRSNGGGQLVLIGTGYGAEGTIRNRFTEVVSCSESMFTWSLPASSSISCAVEIMNHSTSGAATVYVHSSGTVTFAEITALTTEKQNTQLLTTANYTSYLGYIGTTAVKATSGAGQDLTGIGTVYIQGTQGTYREGIRIKPYSSWSTIVLGGTDLTADSGTSTKSWGIFNNDGNFYITKNGSSSSSTAMLSNVSNNWNFAKGEVKVTNKFTAAATVYFTGLGQGTSDVTDDTEILTSYAGTGGFANTTGAGQVYRRQATKMYNYIKGKLDSVYAPKTHTHYIGKTATQASAAKQNLIGIGDSSFEGVMNIKGKEDSYTQGIRIHDASTAGTHAISSIWFRATADSGINAGMLGLTADSTGLRIRLPDTSAGSTVTDRVNILYGGKVGIGVTTPTNKLDVSGGLLSVTHNGNTLTIGSNNTSWTHFTNSSSRPFYFSNSASFNGNVYPYVDSSFSLGLSTNKWKMLYAVQGTFSAAAGTAPLIVDSSTLVSNLNADYLDGEHAYELRAKPKNNSYIIFSSLPFLENGIGMFSSTPAVSMENAPEGLCYGPITSYKQYTSDFIAVEPGETVYGEIWAYRASGATGTAGTLYYGIQRYDRNKKPISANAGLNAPNNGYFVCSGTTVPADGTWHKYSNTHTIPTSHTVYSGSDGKGVYYVKVYVLVNYSAGTIPTYIGRFLLSRKVQSAVSADTTTSSSKVETVACTSTGNHYLTFVDSNNSPAAEETVYTTSKTVIQPSTGNLITDGYVAVGTGKANSYIGSDSASNIWLHNSSGYAVVCDGNVVRRGQSLTNGQLGEASYPWAKVYGTNIYTRYIEVDSSTAGNTAHIQFNRASYNYIQIPTGGTLSVNINGAGSANSYFKIDSTGVYPGDKDASYNLGSASLRWKDFYTAKANVRQTASAALGIATSTPYKIGTAKKDINIETIANGSGTGINDGYAAGLTFGDTTAAYAGIYYQTSGSYGSRLIFATTSSYANGSYGRVIISNSGYVGIGTMSPSQLLHVAGTIYSSVAQGTAPLKVDSSTLVANLHSEFTDYASVLRDPTYHTSSSRRTSANITFADGGLHYYLATSSMTAANGKPVSDGGILHMAWDNSKWDMQLFVPDNPNYGMQWRCQTNGTDASWCPWHTIYDSSNLIPTSLTLSTSDQAFITANGTAYNIKLPATIPWTVSTTDVKVTQTKTTSSNTSWRPLILGLSYSDATTFAPDTCTGTTYATHLAKFKPSTGVLAVVGLNKMKTDGTVDTASDTKCFNTNGGVTTVITSHQTIKQNGITGATRNCYASCTTAAGTAAKTASVTSGTVNLEAGLKVSVKFSNKNTANNPTLNINSKGAKNIFHNGAQITSGTNKGMLYGVVDFVYDGTQWCLVGNYVDTDNNNFNDNVKTKAADSSNATHYITFVDSNNSTATAENVYTSSFLMHNPSLKTFSAGYNNSVTGSYSSALGENITVSNPWSFGHGYNLRIDSSYSHAEGYQTRAMGSSSHAEGMSGNLNTTTVDSSTLAQIRTAHATSGFSLAKGEASHCEGFNTVAFGNNSHAEGQGCITGGAGSHAEGYLCVAVGNYSHVEGCRNYAEGEYSHAEGTDSSAIGNYAHAEGNGTYAGGAASHAEGSGTVVYSTGSHAGGWHTTIGTNASYVFAHGNNIKAQDASYYQGCGVFGCYNNDTASQMRYFFVVGNGTSDTNRSNILEIGYDNRNTMTFGGTIEAKSYRTVTGTDTVTGNSKTLSVGVEHKGNLVELTASGTSTTVALTIQWPNPIAGESCHIIIYNSSSVKKTINIGNVVNQNNSAFTTRKNTSSISIPASGFGEISIIYNGAMYVRSVGN